MDNWERYQDDGLLDEADLSLVVFGVLAVGAAIMGAVIWMVW